MPSITLQRRSFIQMGIVELPAIVRPLQSLAHAHHYADAYRVEQDGTQTLTARRRQATRPRARYNAPCCSRMNNHIKINIYSLRICIWLGILTNWLQMFDMMSESVLMSRLNANIRKSMPDGMAHLHGLRFIWRLSCKFLQFLADIQYQIGRKTQSLSRRWFPTIIFQCRRNDALRSSIT